MAVMNVKQGTRAFSPAPQTSGFKSDGAHNLSAPDRDRALGQESVGDVLNKVADANYVDPAKTQRKVGSNTLDKDAFLKLMLAQMKHQDPTNPMQSHEMAAQLAQFTSLEQLNNINTNLEGMKNAQAPAVGYQALNFIGKRVSGDASKLTRVTGDTNHDVNFQLLGEAAKVKLTVKDADGNVVRKLEFPNLKKGENSVRWNGLSDEGVAARPGEYRLSIEASGPTGNKVFAKTAFDGKITGVNYTASGPVLIVGTQTVKMQDVKKITEDDGGMSAAAGAAAGMSSGPSVAIPPGVAAALSAQGLSVSPGAGQAGAATGMGAMLAPVVKPQADFAGMTAAGRAATAAAAAGAANGPAALETENAVEGANAQSSAAAARAAYPAAAASSLATGPAKMVAANDENVPPAEDAPVQQGNLMSDIAMSRGTINKLPGPKGMAADDL